MNTESLLVIGEIFVDFTIGTDLLSTKMRLGGIVHAARGLWACGIPYGVAAICPDYLAPEAKEYLRRHGCVEFIRIANVIGSPNVIVIRDIMEVGAQGYESLLRDAKTTHFVEYGDLLRHYKNVVIFPGKFDLLRILKDLSPNAALTVDIAYDLDTIEDLQPFSKQITNLVISTSSPLFLSVAANGISEFLSACQQMAFEYLLLKENRGGSRLFSLKENSIYEIPAILSKTVNSVGVGDVYTAIFAALSAIDPQIAVWRGMQVATQYAQTTFPDDFRRDVQREMELTIEEVQGLQGTILPWHDRPNYQIYLAAPDFSYVKSREIKTAISALQYHNFSVRRPIIENGEADNSIEDQHFLLPFYNKDLELLTNCSLLFAVPLNRDPGTLVEMGMAIIMKIPVITFDPYRENANTMVICGSHEYSDNLEKCLNAVFHNLSVIRKKAL
jgi:nucleoside 2-deoxyribosyltransferase/sugar/nucleoside kinase (ribokinase family)